MKTDTPTLIAALRILANEIESGDGVANAAIAEAADRLQEMLEALRLAERFVAAEVKRRDEVSGEGTSTTLDAIRAALAEVAV
jgi:hypothetical protein